MARPRRRKKKSAPPLLPPLIRASELVQYGFCQRAWWLETVKEISVPQPEQLAQGRQAHHRHNRQVASARFWRRLGLVLVALGFVILAGLLLWLGSG
jgi:hypothetical protein